jgi:5-methyltetrahydrofolate corrinoid/iron sulfur protein methyltransferase
MILIADNIQPQNPVVAKAMAERNPRPIRDLAARLADAGAQILDVNPGYLSPRKMDRITFLVETIQGVVSLPLMLDSPHPDILAQGLAACDQPPILNALTQNPGASDRILDLAARNPVQLVLLFMDEHSMSPPWIEGKITLAVQLRERCLAAGIDPQRLIFDPVLPSLRGPDAHTHVGQVVQAVRMLASGAVLGESVKTMAGLSNLRSGQRRRIPERLDEICLGLLAGAGLSHVLMDVLSPANVAAARLMGGFGI